MSIIIENEYEGEINIPYEKIAHEVIEAAIDYVDCPYECEVNLMLTDNETIHAINKEQREIDRPTDVLSFPMAEYEEPADFSKIEEDPMAFDPESGEFLLGDIVISMDKVWEQAENYGHSREREYAFLIAHSMLHLFGYDHMEEEERKTMERMQNEAWMAGRRKPHCVLSRNTGQPVLQRGGTRFLADDCKSRDNAQRYTKSPDRLHEPHLRQTITPLLADLPNQKILRGKAS